jgi:hypothetical protein
VPAGVKHLRTKGLAFSPLLPAGLYMGLSIVWNPANKGVALHDFLALVRENQKRIRTTAGN